MRIGPILVTHYFKGADMNGKGNIRFTELFIDTCKTHGVAWAHAYYLKHGMSATEFGIWLRSVTR